MRPILTLMVIIFLILPPFIFISTGLVNTKNVVCYAKKNGGRPDNFSVETVKHPDGVMVIILIYFLQYILTIYI